ncbi:MAG: hypothetical protein JWM62_2460 [Frankiales bacterium]|nr:hypothetical protein [Frankiales bacterium]
MAPPTPGSCGCCCGCTRSVGPRAWGCRRCRTRLWRWVARSTGRGSCWQGGGRAACGCLPGSPVPCGAELLVHLTIDTALGTSDQPAELVGHSPLEPDLLQALLLAGPRLRPAWTDEQGVVVAVGDRVVLPQRADPASVREALLHLAALPPAPAKGTPGSARSSRTRSCGGSPTARTTPRASSYGRRRRKRPSRPTASGTCSAKATHDEASTSTTPRMAGRGAPLSHAGTRPDSSEGHRPLCADALLGTAGRHRSDPVVGVTGFEPATSASRTQRATKLRHTPDPCAAEPTGRLRVLPAAPGPAR